TQVLNLRLQPRRTYRACACDFNRCGATATNAHHVVVFAFGGSRSALSFDWGGTRDITAPSNDVSARSLKPKIMPRLMNSITFAAVQAPWSPVEPASPGRGPPHSLRSSAGEAKPALPSGMPTLIRPEAKSPRPTALATVPAT